MNSKRSKTIRRDATRIIARLRQNPELVALMSHDDGMDVTRAVVPLEQAFRAYDENRRARLTDHQDGTYSIRIHQGYTFDLYPVGHAELTRFAEGQRQAQERQARIQAEQAYIEAVGPDLAVVRDQADARWRLTPRSAAATGLLNRTARGEFGGLDLLRIAQQWGTESFTVEALPAVPSEPGPEVNPGTLPAVRITLFMEGQATPTVAAGETCWQAADQAIAQVAATVPGGVRKVEAVIEFPDGRRYVSAFDVTERDGQPGTLARHVLRHLAFNAGRWTPDHLSPGRVAAMLEMLGEARRAEAAAFLDLYHIGERDAGSGQPGEIVPGRWPS